MKHKNNQNENKEPHNDEARKHDMHEEIDNIQKELHGLREQFEQLQKEKSDLFSQLQRVSADYMNYQKRSAKQIADTTAYEKESIIKSLLPALDNFEHALAKPPTQETAEALMKGMQIVYRQILDILKLHGVEQITSAGQQFDPEIHSAITQASDPAKPENIVLHEIAKGYKLSGRVIRPSKVVVNKLSTQQTQEKHAQTQPGNDEITDTQ